MSTITKAIKKLRTKVDETQIITVWMPSFPAPAGVKIPAPLLREVLSHSEGEPPNTSFRQSEVFGASQRFYRRPERFIEGVLEWGGVKGYFVEKRDDERRPIDPIVTGPAMMYVIRNAGGDTIDIDHRMLGKALIAAIDVGPNKPREMTNALRTHAVVGL